MGGELVDLVYRALVKASACQHIHDLSASSPVNMQPSSQTLHSANNVNTQQSAVGTAVAMPFYTPVPLTPAHLPVLLAPPPLPQKHSPLGVQCLCRLNHLLLLPLASSSSSSALLATSCCCRCPSSSTCHFFVGPAPCAIIKLVIAVRPFT